MAGQCDRQREAQLRYSGRNLGPSEGGEEGERRRHLRQEACIGKPSTLYYSLVFTSPSTLNYNLLFTTWGEREESIDNQQVTRESEGVV